MQKADTALAVLTVALGLWIAASGLTFGYSRNGAPGPGFFPFWIGLGMSFLGAINVWRSISRKEEFSSDVGSTSALLQVGGLALAVAIFLLVVDHIGMLLGSGILVFVIGLIIKPALERGFLFRLGLLAVATPIATYFVFVVNLGVRIIPGPFGF